MYELPCASNFTEWTPRGRVRLQYHAVHVPCPLLRTGFVTELRYYTELPTNITR